MPSATQSNALVKTDPGWSGAPWLLVNAIRTPMTVRPSAKIASWTSKTPQKLETARPENCPSRPGWIRSVPT